jgi:2-oxoglutarate dehydrogenase E2 component (dihydrolipoamide succinyltransferase)
MRTPILLPDLGADAVVFSLWLAAVGELVYQGDRLAEVRAAGATFDVPSPATGTLVELSAWPRDPLQIGQVLGIVESTPEEDRDTP